MNDEQGKTKTSAWAWVPAGLLGSMLLGLGSMAYVAIDDPSFALEPNYYDKSLRWDQSQAEKRASLALGYRVELTQPLVQTTDQQATVELVLQDRDGAPLAAAQVEVEAFPNATANRIQRLTLREVAPGRYQARLSRAALGLWELRVEVRHAGQRYREVLRRDVTKAGAA